MLALAFLAAIDMRTMRLPNLLTLPLIGLGLVQAIINEPNEFQNRACAAAVGYIALFIVAVVYSRLRNRAGLGLGDAKLFAASGAWTGLEGLPIVLLIGSVSALIAVGVARSQGEQITAATRLPFGPFLALGTWLVWTYAPLFH